jgi:formylglycine-generating enzyme required for sulfatase activity
VRFLAPPTALVPGAAGLAGFRLGLTPVTNAQYAAFAASGRAEPPPWRLDPAFAALDKPVVGVTWFDASGFAEWLTAETGSRWRLPSEAEWEHAARGGLVGAATAWGDALPPGEVREGPLAGPWPVGRGTPNGYGLFDVGTIVHEWCIDWHDPESQTRRASRGGSWRHHVRWSPPGARSSLPPHLRYADYGFRVLQETGQA